MAWKMDEIDRKILAILRENANIPNAALGKKVGLSEPAARRRVANLLKRGVIRRFTIEVSQAGAVSAIVFVRASPQIPLPRIAGEISKVDGVGFLYELSGQIDIAFSIFAQDIESLNAKIDAIREIKGVEKTELAIIMKKWR
ncbi:MAG: Lrp/AsnC family transcriptional regulator [Candidatus Micrarchaeota archaeon]|nr:Lrp/AsnC family transcriptional regulator [Candidatus Micrarchaeota archaeon]